MRLGERRRVVLWLLPITVLVGCSGDREAKLVGKWKGSPLGGVVAAVKMKEGNPSATGSQVAGAARMLSSTALEIRKDKTFTLVFGPQLMTGAWTFDKKSGEMLLNVATVEMPGAADKQQGAANPMPWVAYLDSDNSGIGLYPGTPETVVQLKKTPGAMTTGIRLYKDQ